MTQIKYFKQEMVYNFLFFFIIKTVLFCVISISKSHYSSINLAAFLCSHLQLTTFQEELLSQSSIFKHSHLHLSLFDLCSSLHTVSFNKHSHLQLL